MRTDDTRELSGFAMDLQRFAESPGPTDPAFWEDGGQDQGATAQGSGEHPEGERPVRTSAQTTEPTGEPQESKEGGQAAGGEPGAAAKTDEGYTFAGRSYPSQKEAEKAYKSLQGELTRMRQGLPPKDPSRLEQLLGGQPAPAGPQAQPGYSQGYPQVYPQQQQGFAGYQQQAQQAGLSPQQFGAQVQQAVAQDVAKAKDPKKVWAEIAKDPDAYYEQKAEAVATRLLQQAAGPIVQAVGQMQIQNALQTMRSDGENFPGFRELEGDIAAYIQANPDLARTSNGLAHAYNAVAGINARAGMGEVRQAKETRTAQVEADKTRVSTEGQRARQQPPPPKDPAEAEADAIVAAATRKRFKATPA